MNRPAVLRHIQTQVRCRRLAFRLRLHDADRLMAYIIRLEANQRPPPPGDDLQHYEEQPAYPMDPEPDE